jgi:hypothetical protein
VWGINIDPAISTAVVTLVSAFLVWLVPNDQT